MSNETVIAVATAVNVVVTAVYAYFTWRLWTETRQQAKLTKDQAAQTRELFEAAHRPWVSIEPFQSPRYPFSDGVIRLEFRLHNHGTSPAFITRWIRHWDLDSSDRGPLSADPAAEAVTWCVFPNAEGKGLEITFGDASAMWHHTKGSRFEVGALYHGPDRRPRSTRLIATLLVRGRDEFALEGVKHEAD